MRYRSATLCLALGFAALAGLAGCSRGSADESAAFTSEKPLFLKLVVLPDPQQTLNLAFDESKGTGKGYDRLYMDSNYDGKFEPSEVADARVTEGFTASANEQGVTRESTPVYDFPTFTVSLTEVLQETAGTLTLHLAYLPLRELHMEIFSLEAQRAVEYDGANWLCSMRGSLTPAAILEEASVVNLAQPPKLTLKAGPTKDALGIAGELRAGDLKYSVRQGDSEVPVQLKITDAGGTVVKQESLPMSKIGFG